MKLYRFLSLQIISSQSTENVFVIKKFDVGYVGNYLCEAKNDLGRDSKNVSLTINLAPVVKVFPDKLTVKKDEIGTLQCMVEGNRGEFKTLWMDEFGLSSVKVSRIFVTFGHVLI